MVWRCDSSPWRGKSPLEWQFMQRGWRRTGVMDSKAATDSAPRAFLGGSLDAADWASTLPMAEDITMLAAMTVRTITEPFACSRWPRNCCFISAVQGIEYAFRGERNCAQARARRIEDGVSDCGRSNRDRCLAGPEGRYTVLRDKHTFDSGHVVVEIEAFVSLPINGGDAFVVPGNLLNQRATDRLQDAAFALIFQAIGVGDWPAIHGQEKALRANNTGSEIDFNVRYKGGVTISSFIVDAGDTTAICYTVADGSGVGRRSRLPLRGVGCSLNNRDESGIPKMLDAESHRIGLGMST